MWENLISVLVGGIIGLIGSVISCRYQRKIASDNHQHERNMRLAEKRAELYLKLAGVIDDIPIPIAPTTCVIDAAELKKHLQALADVVEENKNAMALFANQSIRNDLMHLNSNILKIINSKDAQRIDFSTRESFESSPMFAVVKQAKSILSAMRKDLAA